MTKADIKLLCETDDQLEWWAMVLFAEIAELVNHQGYSGQDKYPIIEQKVKEFDQIIINSVREKAVQEARRREARK